MCTLKLNGLWVECIIGDRPEERVRSQRIRVDVALPIGEKVCETDQLADTVDYAALKRKIEKTLQDAKCQMIERAAKIVYDVVGGGSVTITKYGAIPGLESASVTYSA